MANHLDASLASPRHRLVLDAIEGGKTLKEAGALIGVNRERARQIANRFGVSKRTRSELKLEDAGPILDLFARGMLPQHIACTLKMSPDVVLYLLTERLGVREKDKSNGGGAGSGNPWTKDQVRTLRKMLRAGATYASIGKAVGKSLGSVCSKVKRLGLAKPLIYCDRDEDGWHVPKAGTRARDVYDLLKQGMSSRQIERRLGLSNGATRSYIWHIREPDAWLAANANRQRELRRRKKQAELDESSAQP